MCKIDKEELFDYFILQNHTQQECAKHFGVGRSSIGRFLRTYGISKDKSVSDQQKSRPSNKKVNIDLNLLERLYIEENMTIQEVADKLGINYRAVQKRLSENGIRKDRKSVAETSARNISTESSLVLERRKRTCLEKYGVEFSSQDKGVRKKTEETFLRKYGAKSPLSSKEVRDKGKQTMLSRYGYDSAAKSDSVKRKSRDTCLKKYGVENPAQRLEHRKKMSKYFLSRTGKYDDPGTVSAVLMNKESLSNCIGSVGKFLQSIGVTCRKARDIIPPYEIDFYSDEYKIGIEFNGNYFHSDLRVAHNYHYKKSVLAEKAGVRLIHIYEYEWTDPQKRPIIESVLKISFGKIKSRIYARECEIREITNQQAKLFNDANHLQGHRNAKLTYGLFYKGKLVQLMSFSKNRKYEWEIIRGCPGSNNIVVGGVSKLFDHFLKTIHPSSVFSYADFNKFDGSGYLKLGMEFIGYTGPDVKYFINGTAIPRQPHRHSEMESSCDFKIWGSGSKKFVWVNKQKGP